MAEGNMAPRCPKCDAPRSHRIRYCPGGNCRHQQTTEHLYEKCDCEFEFNILPCRDSDALKERPHVKL